MSTARDEILARIRGALASDPSTRSAPSLPEGPVGNPGRLSIEERSRRFTSQLEAVAGQVHPVANRAEAAGVLRSLCLERGVSRAVVSDAPGLGELFADTGLELECRSATESRATLFRADLGLSRAQLGIAETGTLVLLSSEESHRLASLVPGVHVALLSEDDLVDGLEEALAVVGSTGPAPAPAVTFITGPSRTADIELTLVVGVHGPRELHVLLMKANGA